MVQVFSWCKLMLPFLASWLLLFVVVGFITLSIQFYLPYREMFSSKLLQKISTCFFFFIFKENLRSFTKDARALIYKDLPFETLEVEAKVALEIFQHNK